MHCGWLLPRSGLLSITDYARLGKPVVSLGLVTILEPLVRNAGIRFKYFIKDDVMAFPPLTVIFLLNRLKPRYPCMRTQAGRSELIHACCPYSLLAGGREGRSVGRSEMRGRPLDPADAACLSELL